MLHFEEQIDGQAVEIIANAVRSRFANVNKVEVGEAVLTLQSYAMGQGLTHDHLKPIAAGAAPSFDKAHPRLKALPHLDLRAFDDDDDEAFILALKQVVALQSGPSTFSHGGGPPQALGGLFAGRGAQVLLSWLVKLALNLVNNPKGGTPE